MPHARRLSLLLPGSVAAAVLLGATLLGRAPVTQPAASASWGPWLEDDAPFFSSVVDGRSAGMPSPADNLAPRALVLRAGADHWVAFDPDLLRVVAAWTGRGVTQTALAPGSYHKPDRKTPGGQRELPRPDGPVLVATGLYPGWQAGDEPVFADPRRSAPSPEEAGRGPLAFERGRFSAIRMTSAGAVLEYDVEGVAVQEWTGSVPGRPDALLRHVLVQPGTRPLWLVLGAVAPGIDVAVAAEGPVRPALESRAGPGGGTVHVVRVPARAAPLRFCVVLHAGPSQPPVALVLPPAAPAAPRWRAEVTTRVTRSEEAAAYVVDDIALPTANPWNRQVRPGDIQFRADGTGAVVTLDGDVWIARGLASADGVVRWRRFASGLHEPLSLSLRDDVIHVFDRNGIWRLIDRDDDGEADRHELFSNAFAQTADTREFPSTLRLGPGGEFVIAKGGQEATTIGRHNGSVLRISADGRSATVLGYGLRQPQIGVHPQTGLVTSSDQQGHYIPSTPLHIVKDTQFYGFLSDLLPKEVYPAPIAAPVTWIPHDVNASAMSQVWLLGSRMGPLDGGLVHIGYNRPEVFRVLPEFSRPVPQAAVVSLTDAFDYPPLNGAVNPSDGQLYIAGFQILGWGTTATRLAGLGRVRYTGAPVTAPRQVTPMREGVLLRFDVDLDPASIADPTHYDVASWSYRRTFRYGSPKFKADGTPGVDALVPSRAWLSSDGRGVFVAVPDLRPVMQLEVAWRLRARDGTTLTGKAYTTPYALEPFVPRAEGFGDLVLDLTRRVPTTATPGTTTAPTAAEGRELFARYGCLACHATEAAGPSTMGPSLVGLFGSSRAIADRATPVVADEAYIRQSLLEPAAAVADGYQRAGVGMPSFAGVLTDAQIDAIVLYLKGLK